MNSYVITHCNKRIITSVSMVTTVQLQDLVNGILLSDVIACQEHGNYRLLPAAVTISYTPSYYHVIRWLCICMPCNLNARVSPDLET